MLQSWTFLSGFVPPSRTVEAPDVATLVAHIVERFHEAHRAEFPDAIRLARKVEAVHADHSAAPLGLADHLSMMFDDLEAHQQREERVLFPTLLQGGCAVVVHPIRRMMTEHEDVYRQLETLRTLTSGYKAPDEACRTWRALYAACRKLDEDLVEHMRLENEELFAPFLE